MAPSLGSTRTTIGTQPSPPSLYNSDRPNQVNHVQQWGYYQCGHQFQWRVGSNFSSFLHDRWNHYLAQFHDWYYILNIHQGFELWMYLDSVPSHHPYHQCPGYARNLWIGGTNGHSACFVLRLERDWYHSKSPSDPGLLDDRAIIGPEDCEPEQLAHHDDHWRSQRWA